MPWQFYQTNWIKLQRNFTGFVESHQTFHPHFVKLHFFFRFLKFPFRINLVHCTIDPRDFARSSQCFLSHNYSFTTKKKKWIAQKKTVRRCNLEFLLHCKFFFVYSTMKKEAHSKKKILMQNGKKTSLYFWNAMNSFFLILLSLTIFRLWNSCCSLILKRIHELAFLNFIILPYCG